MFIKDHLQRLLEKIMYYGLYLYNQLIFQNSNYNTLLYMPIIMLEIFRIIIDK